MSEITVSHQGALSQISPEDARGAVMAFDARAKLEARRGNLDSACDAFDRAVAIQRAFVLWWDAQEKDAGGHASLYAGNGSVTGSPKLPADLDKMTVSRWRKDLIVPGAPADESAMIAFLEKKHAQLERLAGGGKPDGAHQANNSGQNEWYTPADYIDAARAVMGTIDLDPASSEKANETVRAATYYDAATNGLEQPWHGNVWMNPPYAQPLIGQFVERLARAWSEGEITAAIVLVNNGTDSRWGQTLLGISAAACFPAGRIRFVDPHGQPGESPLQGQMFAYCGDHVGAFRKQFQSFGVTLCR